MKILHTSDLHGSIRSKHLLCDFDIWIDTGDFFPNKTRGERSVEIPHQKRWFERKAAYVLEALNGRPLISVPGNHDYISLAQFFHNYFGYENAHEIVSGKIVEVNNIRFGGFPNIPWIEGEWNYETHNAEMSDIVQLCPLSDIDVLLTHAPPGSILDIGFGNVNYGIPSLTSALFYTEHNIKHHFFGHIHTCGGMSVEQGGIQFYNGATKRIIHEI